MLTAGLMLGERTRVQGVADGMIWTSAAVASLSSGVIVAGASYTPLGLLGLAPARPAGGPAAGPRAAAVGRRAPA